MSLRNCAIRLNISRGAGIASYPWEENLMYAAIRHAKAKAGSAEELARRIKAGAIPIINEDHHDTCGIGPLSIFRQACLMGLPKSAVRARRLLPSRPVFNNGERFGGNLVAFL